MLVMGVMFMVTACDPKEPEAPTCDTWSECALNSWENLQVANPASVKCIEDGGTLLPQEDEEGNQFANCQFPNGKVCEEWKYFRGECSSEDPQD